ncbi:MAG TPA: LpxI family protein [bacterium]|nr:LpxI family protein [bacterium]
MKPAGLVAGGGSLPVLFLKSAAEKGIQISVFAVKGETEAKELGKYAKVYEVKITELSRIIDLCKKEGIDRMVLLGYIRHVNLVNNIKFDMLTVRTLMKLKDFRAASVMRGIIDVLSEKGIKVLKSTYLLEHLLAGKGNTGKTAPGRGAVRDMELGIKMAKKTAGLDIGQTVVVKKGVVVAVEAMEGTDKCIRRAAEEAGPGFVVVKAARPKQDMRYDVPVVGEKTIDLIEKHKGAGIALEAGKTFLLDREKIIKKADKAKIFIAGY